MEVDVIGRDLYSHWLIKNRGGPHQPVKIGSLINILTSFAQRDQGFTIRYCGYTEAYCSCTGKEQQGWECYSGNAEFHSCGRTGYEGSFYGSAPGSLVITGWPVVSARKKKTFSHSLYSFRRDCEKAGFLDKYHSDAFPLWKDDDCYIKLGTLTENMHDFTPVIGKMREYMSGLEPVIIELKPEHVDIIVYRNTSLTRENIIEKLPLLDVVKHPDSLEELFHYVKKHKSK
jgi:hypothetical protein